MNVHGASDQMSRVAAEMTESIKRHRILLMDSDIDMQATLTVLLEPNFIVETASTTSEGFRCLNTAKPDIVILDTGLPDISGAYFLQSLRVRVPACPVIVLTESEQSETLRNMIDLRVEGLCCKPVHVGRLLEQVAPLITSQTKSSLLTSPHRLHAYKAIQYINQNYSQHLTVKAVADAVGISASHLAHLFRRSTGMPVREYITKVRIEVTRRLLTNTNETLDNISERVGFCDASHVSRVFRHHVGYWPGEYCRR